MRGIIIVTLKLDQATNYMYSQISGFKPKNNVEGQTYGIKPNLSQKANHYFDGQMTFKKAKLELFGFQKTKWQPQSLERREGLGVKRVADVQYIVLEHAVRPR